MLRRVLLAALIIFTATVSSRAQDVQDSQSKESAVIQRWPTREAQPVPSAPAATAEPQPAPTARVAQPRRTASPAAAAAAAPAPPVAADAEQQRRPSGRDRDTGRVAVPRQAPRPSGPDAGRRADPSPRGGRPTVYVARPPVARYYYPRSIYPYGYGAFGGLGYFYYDPYSWSASAPLYAYGPGAYGPGYYGRGYGYDIGEVRFRVTPRDAQVFVDGFYAGEVDDYDGILQSLRLESGEYHIELVAPGFAPLEVDIRVSPGQKVTYRGDLRRAP